MLSASRCFLCRRMIRMVASFSDPLPHSVKMAVRTLDVGGEPSAPEYPIPPRVYPGVSKEPFSSEATKVLTARLSDDDIEVLPDGTLYLPEIKYRRTLNNAFGAGGWVILPRSPAKWLQSQQGIIMLREYALFCKGRFVAEAVGEYVLEQPSDFGMAFEAARSKALKRCCKDLGVASELWDLQFTQSWREKNTVKVVVTNALTGQKRLVWKRKDAAVGYPWKESLDSS